MYIMSNRRFARARSSNDSEVCCTLPNFSYGYPDPEDPEKVYFACFDTDISTPATGYRMDYVRRALEERKALIFGVLLYNSKIDFYF